MAEYRSHFYFNSRLSARGYCVAAQYDFCIIISIHASLREATTDNLILISETVFQFTPLCERLPLFHTKVPRCTLFQFTPLCERLLFPAFLSLLLFYFNSRLSARGYKVKTLISDKAVISIHASLREATIDWSDLGKSIFISIHASLREATWWRCSYHSIDGYFNSRLSARGYSKNRQYIAVFQLNFCLISLLCYIHSIIL